MGSLERDLLERTAARAADYLDTLGDRPIHESATVEELRAALGGPLPEGPADAREVVDTLADAVDQREQPQLGAQRGETRAR